MENKNNINADEEMCAWRRQIYLAHFLTRDCSDQAHHALMKENYFKLEENDLQENYLEIRVNRTERILSNLQLPKETSQEFPTHLELNCESPCRGTYESCSQEEISDDQLATFRTQTNSQNPAEKTAATKNNKTTLMNFLQTKPCSPRLEATSSNTSVEPKISEEPGSSFNAFRTAREELVLQNLKKAEQRTITTTDYGALKKTLGTRRGVRSGFVPPVARNETQDSKNRLETGRSCSTMWLTNPASSNGNTEVKANPAELAIEDDSRLDHIDPKMVEIIKSEIMSKYKPMSWDEIAGLHYAKSIIMEAVVYPFLRPDIFTGLRRPPRGILLFGPPGTGKTLIGKCIASQSKATFFSISPSTLTSKWVGDSERLVKALFAVAAAHQPAVIFIDEIDSLLSQRSETEHDSSRRLKNEFLIQLDGAATSEDERILIIGATNRPKELDEAARRRFLRRLYVPLPELNARIEILTKLLKTITCKLSKEEIESIGQLTDGYSGADIESLCRDAAMEPIRSITMAQIGDIIIEHVRPIDINDFHTALENVRPSVSQDGLQQYIDWNNMYGASR